MALEVDDGQHTGLGLESEHALVGRLVLPGARTDQGGASEVKAFMAVDVSRDEDVRNFSNDQSVLWFRRKWGFASPLWSKMTSTEQFTHGFHRVGVRDGA